MDRTALLIPKKKKNEENLMFITTYHRESKYKEAINQSQYILELSPGTELLSKMKIITAYRRNRTLGNDLVRASLKTPPKPGSKNCGKNCTTCQYMKIEDNITSHKNKKSFRILSHITCETPCVIYAIQCKLCGIQYIGQTGNNIKTRLSSHLQDIKNTCKAVEKPVANHFTSPPHDVTHIDVIGITIAPSNVNGRLRLEEAYIYAIQTTTPWGLNIKE